MPQLIERPESVQINAYDGTGTLTSDLPSRTPWGQRQKDQSITRFLGPAVAADLRDWQHPEVGWGVILPDDDSVPIEARARGEDAHPAIQKLLAHRSGAPVLRWREEFGQDYLRRYYVDGRFHDLSAAAIKPGVQDGHIPRYLLIVAGPQAIPWSVQYALNMSTFVGRVEPSEMLSAYVDALIDDWAGFECHPEWPVVWSVNHGRPDITNLMQRAIADILWSKFAADPEFKGERIENQLATRENLCAALIERSPGLVITTSHGTTGPTSDAQRLKRQLGLPVDANYTSLNLADLANWKPAGAIWYAHACCSAGSDSTTRYEGLLPEDSSISRMLANVASTAKAMIAPLALSLIGAVAPLRAFVGHVEPTFDWTLRDPANGQGVTHALCTALYDNLYQPDRRTPIGYALRGIFSEAGAYYGAVRNAIEGINNNVPGMRDHALYNRLVAMDRQTTVIIGDPTVSLPRPT
ncbi:hypothetical protein ACFSHT_05620 [Paraburkholderia silviterrae]|uniref:Uncharacterized protein n=1 Tax=Paraburkholderia silviterrae TaxID=2528715 RepID=A0A4R5M5S5_9BURK|nr:hypothetical protein [Paraburkholderia silviterrae]TDG20629.1 hypothetical protein EYW47_26035 [Paraburkholderia silviterrae]